MVKETTIKVNRPSNFQPQPHPRLSKLRQQAILQPSKTSNAYGSGLNHISSLTDSLPDLLEGSSSLSTSTSPSTASSGCASFSSATSTSSSSSSSSSTYRSHVLSEPISFFLGTKKQQQQQQQHIYEDIDVRGPIRMTPISGVMLEEKKGLIKPLPFKPIPRCNISSSSNNDSNSNSNCITKSTGNSSSSITSNSIHKNNNSITGTKSRDSSSKFTTKSNPVNNLNQQQSHHHHHHQHHQPVEESPSSIMCNRMVVASDLRHKLSDRISCISPFYSPSNVALDDESTDAAGTTGGGTRNAVGDSSHQLQLMSSPSSSLQSSSSSSSSTASSSTGKGGTILGQSNFPIKQQQQQPHQLNQLVDEPRHHSPLTYVMNSTCSSSGIGDSSSSSSQSFTTQSQCSMSQSSYLLDDDVGPPTSWYSPTFDPHHHIQPHHHHHNSHNNTNTNSNNNHQHHGHHLHQLKQHNNHHHHQQVHEKTHKSNNNNHNNNNSNSNSINSNTGNTSNTGNNNNNGNNPVLPPKQRPVIFSPSSQRHKTVQRSSTFNSDDLTMQSTPSPCSDNDTVHGMTMNELESLVREKDAQISYLRETLEQNEQVIFKVYEEKEQSWQKEYKKLRTQFESSLMLYQQKALKAESELALATKQAKEEQASLLATIEKHKESNLLLERKVAELRRQVNLKASAGPGPVTLPKKTDDEYLGIDAGGGCGGEFENEKTAECKVDDGQVTKREESTKFKVQQQQQEAIEELNKKKGQVNEGEKSNCTPHNNTLGGSCKLIDRQVQQVKPFPCSRNTLHAYGDATTSSSGPVCTALKVKNNNSNSNINEEQLQQVGSAVDATACTTSRKLPSSSKKGPSDSKNFQEWHTLTSRHDFSTSTAATTATTGNTASDFNSSSIASFSNINSDSNSSSILSHQASLQAQLTNIQLLQEQVGDLLGKLKSSEIQVTQLTIENTDLRLLQAKLTSELKLIQDSFDVERSIWKDEKDKVIQYQKQLNRNFLQILRKNKELELEIKSLREGHMTKSTNSNSIYQITTGETTC